MQSLVTSLHVIIIVIYLLYDICLCECSIYAKFQYLATEFSKCMRYVLMVLSWDGLECGLCFH